MVVIVVVIRYVENVGNAKKQDAVYVFCPFFLNIRINFSC